MLLHSVWSNDLQTLCDWKKVLHRMDKLSISQLCVHADAPLTYAYHVLQLYNLWENVREAWTTYICPLSSLSTKPKRLCVIKKLQNQHWIGLKKLLKLNLPQNWITMCDKWFSSRGGTRVYHLPSNAFINYPWLVSLMPDKV